MDLLFPPKCVFCGRVLNSGESGICPECQGALPCWTETEAEQRGEFFSLCVSPLRYQDRVRDSIHRYKFSGRQGYARIYGRLMAQCISDRLAGRYDLITWVPLSRRGNGNGAMIRRFFWRMQLPWRWAMWRWRRCARPEDTRAQSGLDGEPARRANVLGAYEIVDPELIEGKRVLLIDDVITTGATISECARLLRTFGAADVVCATLARAH